MKKALTKSMFIALTIVIFAAMIPLSVSANSSNKQTVFNFLTDEMGLNSAAACGIMANIEHESGFSSSTVARDSNGLLSGGLCMWNGGRFNSLKNYCNNNGYNYLGITGQLYYLRYELNQQYYKHILNYLKGVSDSSNGAYNAAYYWCYYFEIPANRTSNSARRGNSAINNYWYTYGNRALSPVTLKISGNDTALDLDDNAKFTWTKSGSPTTGYKLYLTKKGSDGYNFDKAKVFSIGGANSTSKTIDLSPLKIGKYCVFVRACNGNSGKKSGISNKIYFSVDCLTHKYVTTIVKDATLTNEGISKSVCSQCKKTVTKKLPVITAKKFAAKTMSTPKLVKASTSSITIKWNQFSGASGYVVFQRVGDKWKKLGTTAKTYFNVSNLKYGTDYIFVVKAYSKIGGKVYFSKGSGALKAPTACKQPYIYSIDRTTSSKAVLDWKGVQGADGYVIYISKSPDSGYSRIATLSSTARHYTSPKLTSGKYYYFKLRAYSISSDKTKVYSSPSTWKYIIAL